MPDRIMGPRSAIDTASIGRLGGNGQPRCMGAVAGPYDQEPEQLARTWEQLEFERVHAPTLPFIPTAPGLVLDVGAGSGRDAAWFAARGWNVVAVEPATGMRELGHSLHPSAMIRWENDRLPGLERTLRLGVSFDLVWLSAVWMHVAPPDRRRAFRKLVTLLKPGGRMMLSLRLGPPPPGRPMHPADAAELETLAVEHGLSIRAVSPVTDGLGRAEIAWTTLILELPDDGTGALPLLRGMILDDRKSATYKLALLRVLARIADQSAALAQYQGDHVDVPLGLVALYWLRMFKALVAADILQAPGHRGRTGLGFVQEAFAAVDEVSAFELRPGASFEHARGVLMARALGDAASTIARMPAHHLTYADGRPIFATEYQGRPRLAPQAPLIIEPGFLWRYGATCVPTHLWVALRRLVAWVEPMLLAEWSRLSMGFAAAQGHAIGHDSILRALRWINPERDTAITRRIVSGLLDSGRPIHCIWSGARLTDIEQVEVDHCFPFSAWPCDDLWNLMPASRRANGRKRDLLVSDATLTRAEDLIQSWWSNAYRDAGDPIRARQFTEEALASLPVDRTWRSRSAAGLGLDDVEAKGPWLGERAGGTDLNAVFAALRYQRLRLRQDQILPEWEGFGR